MSVHPTYFDLTTPLFASAGSRKEQCSHRGQEGRTSEISQTPELLFGTAAVVSSSGEHCSSRYDDLTETINNWRVTDTKTKFIAETKISLAPACPEIRPKSYRRPTPLLISVLLYESE